MFRGNHDVNMDAKGRVAIPARFRDPLAAIASDQVVVTIDPKLPNLMMYPIEVWDVIQAEISSLPSMNAHTTQLKQLLIGNAFDLTIDANGRILLPAVLREHAGLDKGLKLVGLDKKVEIWAADKWAERFQDIQLMDVSDDDLPPELKTLSF